MIFSDSSVNSIAASRLRIATPRVFLLLMLLLKSLESSSSSAARRLSSAYKIFERLCHSLWREQQQNELAVNLYRIARLPSSCFALRHAKSAITQITVEWYHRNIARLHLLSQITPRHPSHAPLHSAFFCLRKKNLRTARLACHP